MVRRRTSTQLIAMHSNEQRALEMVSMWTQKQEQRKAIFFPTVCDNIHCRHIRSFSLLGWSVVFLVLSKTLIGSFLRKPENYAQYVFAEISTHVLLSSRHTGIAAHIKSKANAYPKMATWKKKVNNLAIDWSICMECVTSCPVRTQFVTAFNVCMFVFFFISLSYFQIQFSLSTSIRSFRIFMYENNGSDKCIELILSLLFICIFLCLVSNWQISAVSAMATLCKCGVRIEYFSSTKRRIVSHNALLFRLFSFQLVLKSILIVYLIRWFFKQMYCSRSAPFISSDFNDSTNKRKQERSSNESHEQSMVNDPFDADVAIFKCSVDIKKDFWHYAWESIPRFHDKTNHTAENKQNWHVHIWSFTQFWRLITRKRWWNCKKKLLSSIGNAHALHMIRIEIVVFWNVVI